MSNIKHERITRSRFRSENINTVQSIVQPLTKTEPVVNKVKVERKTKSRPKSENVEQPKPSKRKVNDERPKLNVPIDKECKTKIGKAEVYVEGDDVYDVMLNQTNLQFNNNKFYIIQLLKDIDTEYYSVWMRWARVGKVGQNKLDLFKGDLEAAKKRFTQKFHDKTKNCWEDRANFEKVDGKYDLLQMEYKDKENDDPADSVKQEKKVKLEILDCKLEEKIQDLMRTIFDMKEMDETVHEMNYDANKLPLGRLTEAQIKAGYKALREVEGLLNEGRTGDRSLVKLCNTYYTRIPHDFGMRVPPVIRSMADIKRELELLETLSDIKVALELINSMSDSNTHPLDKHYDALKCDIKLVDPSLPIHEIINSYLTLTHGSTHSDYNMKMLNLFELHKTAEHDNFKDYGNKMLLWHGSRTSNYGGILRQGLRIAPPEAPVTGHMFGKGVYFADTSSKSANYCGTTRTKNTGFLLLCEVSLGQVRELYKADSRAARLPKGFHSVKGLGIIAPSSETYKKIDPDVVVPVGKQIDTGISSTHKGYLLNYNEYIVYNRDQIKMRYMVHVKFGYK